MGKRMTTMTLILRLRVEKKVEKIVVIFAKINDKKRGG